MKFPTVPIDQSILGVPWMFWISKLTGLSQGFEVDLWIYIYIFFFFEQVADFIKNVKIHYNSPVE